MDIENLGSFIAIAGIILIPAYLMYQLKKQEKEFVEKK
ncbi:unknown [Clostridium sp. CAG:306]|nr:unknown [Clostridium sp. CAG:306]